MSARRIRVLYTIPNFNTAGSGRSVYDLIKGLDQKKFEAEVCCFHDKGIFFNEVKDLGVKIHLFQFTTTLRPRATFISRVLKIRQFFKSQNFDIIHSWHWSSDISEPLAARLAGIPYVYTKKAMGFQGRHWKIRSRLSTRIIAVNQDIIENYFSNILHKVIRFPLAIDVAKFQPMQPSNQLEKALGLKPNDFVIVSIANLVGVKGIEILLDAVGQLNNSRVKILIVGDDSSDYATQLKNHYASHNYVQFIGKQLDVRPYLALSNLFVIPTKDEGRREGIPNAPLEAMAMERIVLGSDISGIRDILSKFPNCLFKAGDNDELKNKIQMVMGLTREERESLGKAMRKQVVDRFATDDFIKNHEQLYSEMVNS